MAKSQATLKRPKPGPRILGGTAYRIWPHMPQTKNKKLGLA